MLITIGGQEYPIRFTMSTWKEMEEDCGLQLSSISDLKSETRMHERAKIVVRMLAPMIRAGSNGSLSVDDAVRVLGGILPEEYGLAVLVAGECIRQAMQMQQRPDGMDDDYDPVLRRLDAEAGRKSGKTLTWRRVTAWGLIAGLTLADQREMIPGMVLDMFIARMDYDDEQHGIRRKGKEHDNLLDCVEPEDK